MKTVLYSVIGLGVVGGGALLVADLYQTAKFERGRQQFLAETTDLVPAKEEEPPHFTLGGYKY